MSYGEMAVVPLVILTGDTRQVTLRFVEDGDPVNLVGRTFLSQIRTAAGDPDPLATFTIDATDAATGVIRLSLSAAVTGGLQPGNAVWDVQETYSGVVTTLAGGPVTIQRDVSR